MLYLILIIVSCALFFAFITVTLVERKRGTRILEHARRSLDTSTAYAAEVVRSADPALFLIRGARILFGHIFHDLANVLLAVVRILERTLSGTVHSLRGMRKPVPRTETSSSFVKSIAFHKRTLRKPVSSSGETPVEEVE